MSVFFFSIAIPTYEFNDKGIEYLNKNFELLNEQTFKNFEVVISDDSKNNEIQKFCELWSKKLHIKYVKNNEHSFNSHSPNINNAIANCSGEWIKILFQDDFLYDYSSLENQYNFIMQNKNIFWFFTKFYHTKDGVNLYNLYTPRWNESVWSGNNSLGGPSGLTVKNKNIPLFDENLIWLMDCDFYQKLYLLYGEPLISESITVVNRTSSDQLTTTIKEDRKIKDLNIVNKKYNS